MNKASEIRTNIHGCFLIPNIATLFCKEGETCYERLKSRGILFERDEQNYL